MVKFWMIIEQQMDANGNVSSLVTSKTNYNEALSVYHSILAAAAISNLPYHAAVILESNKGVKVAEYFDRSDNNG